MNLKNIYVIADTHGQEIHCPNWGTLIHLGDYERGKIYGAGFKVLVRGNHDVYTEDFDFICEGMHLSHYYLSHVPLERIPAGAYFNLHGHMHGGCYSDYGYCKKEFHIELCPNTLYELTNDGLKEVSRT